jgi:hypothetical protein
VVADGQIGGYVALHDDCIGSYRHHQGRFKEVLVH